MPIFKGPVRSVFKLVITNTQSIATPSPFQQKLVLNYSMFPTNLIRSDWGNVNFQDGKGNYYPSWLESISGSTATIWVKLPNGIPANSSVTIYMVIIDPSQTYDGVNWGAYPLLTSTYGQYDNGVNVFNFYDNFAGTTLKSVWKVPPCSSYKVCNGFIGLPSVGTSTAVYNPCITETPCIINEWYLNMSSTSYISGTACSYFQLNRYTGNSIMHWLGELGKDALVQDCHHFKTICVSSSGFHIFGIRNAGTTVTWYYDYNPITFCNVTAVTDHLALGWAYNGTTSHFPTINWVRVRAYPPNGVMPSVAIYPFFH